MSTFNRVICTVNLTRDPQVQTTPSGKVVMRLGVASNHESRDANGVAYEEVWFGTVDVFGKAVEVIQQWFRKGDPITIEGRLKTEQWEKNGERQSATKLVLDRFHFVTGYKYQKREAGSAEQGAGRQAESGRRQEPRPTNTTATAVDPEDDGRIPVGA